MKEGTQLYQKRKEARKIEQRKEQRKEQRVRDDRKTHKNKKNRKKARIQEIDRVTVAHCYSVTLFSESYKEQMRKPAPIENLPPSKTCPPSKPAIYF